MSIRVLRAPGQAGGISGQSVQLYSCLCLDNSTPEADRQVESAQESTKRAVFLGLDVMVFATNHKIHMLNGTLSMRTCLLRSMCSDESAMCFGVIFNSCSTQHPTHTATKHHGPGPLRAQNRFSIKYLWFFIVVK